MGWLIILVLAIATFGGLYPFVRRDKGALQFVAAALLLALAGYALQGRPNLAGQPKPPPESASPTLPMNAVRTAS